MKCKNCDKNVVDSFTYCPYCSQKKDVTRLNFQQLLKDLLMAFGNTNRGILLLVGQLFYKPGKVAREYISGKRKTYFNPFSYLAIMLAVALYFILKFDSIGLNYYHMAITDIELLGFAFKYFNVFLLLMCPIYGLLIWLFFLGHQTNFVENLALAAYLSGQTMLYYILALITFILFPSLMGVLGVVFGSLISIWIIVAILQFYKTRSLWSILKSGLVIFMTQFISQGIIIVTFNIYKNLM
jgi:hypothetical protein